jgi:hypothetical protein
MILGVAGSGLLSYSVHDLSVVRLCDPRRCGAINETR